MGRYRVVIAKPGLDGHDRGARIVARGLRDAGFEVIFTGLFQSSDDIVRAVIDEDAAAVGLSILSGAHLELFREVITSLRVAGADDVVVFGGGIIPEEDIGSLQEMGVPRVFTPGSSLGDITQWLQETLGVEHGPRMSADVRH